MPKELDADARRFSGVDSAFLYLERKELPLNIAGVFLLDGPVQFEDFVAAVDSKLHLVPRYREIAVTPPYNLGPPTWTPDPHFDVRRHILRAQVPPPGREAQLEDLAGSLLGQRLDREKPLWEIHVVDGLKDGRGALIVRIHHALADGVSGVSFLKVLFGLAPESSFAIGKRRYRRPKAPAPRTSMVDAIGNAIRGTMDNLLAAEEGLLGLGQALLSGDALRNLAGALPDLLTPVERLPFNKPCSGERKFCWTPLGFAEAQAVRGSLGGTLNDVILTVASRALAKYVRLHGQTVSRRSVRIICPVNLRPEADTEKLGNSITFMPVSVPLDVRDPAENLRIVAARTERMKRARTAEMVALAGYGIAAAPPPLQSLFWSVISQATLPSPLFNIIVTNVPGSPVPVYCAGKRVLTFYPEVPTGYDLGVGIAVSSYAGSLAFGLTADAHVASDVRKLRDFLPEAFEELCASAGVVKIRPKRAASKPRARKPKPKPKPREHVAATPIRKPARKTAPSPAPDAPPPEVERPEASAEDGPQTMSVASGK